MERVNSFLGLISEISKNDIEIDANIVYSNLVTYNSNNEDISRYLEALIKGFDNIKNINIIKEKTYFKFNSFNFKNTENNIKLYIPLDKEHLYRGLTELIMFLSQNNIIHSTKVLNKIRNDNIIVTVDGLFDAEKIRKFIDSNKYIKEGLIKPNPFMYNDGNISYVWEGYLSYNIVLSNWISEYIKEHNKTKKYVLVTGDSFYEFISSKYNSIFENGINVNNFITTKNLVNLPIDLLNYKYITELIMGALNNNILKEFCNKIKSIQNISTHKEEINKIRNIIIYDNTNTEITPEQREIFDYVYIEMSKKKSEEKTIKLFKTFIKTLDYRIFTRDNKIRNMLIENGLTPLVIKKLIYEEMKNALINASIKTMKKYDVVQLGKALFGIKNNDYSAFTNDNNVRNNLRLMVSNNEIDDLLKLFIDSSSNSLDDNYWIFIELISDEIREK